ncbi:MAG: polyhydroxyalkanoate synthesis repressor PhaR [Brevundimonas sp.]|nr:MAG: polyhydroxyalkanoate synthesis repressor PhaR [Brevundimonas sp.]
MRVTDPKAETTKGHEGDTVVIKKYANRRLYNTATSAYVTLDDLAQMVRDGVDFVVYDAKSNEDLTRQILTQIIFEQENRGEALLPVKFLRQLIGYYGGQMQGVLPSYLEMSLAAFTRQQEEMRGQFHRTFGATPGAGLLEEAARRNVEMFTQAVRMWPGLAAFRRLRIQVPPGTRWRRPRPRNPFALSARPSG